MPLWGKNEDAANSVISAAAQVKVAPNTANRDALFGNTTADAFISGATIGQFAVDDLEIAAANGGIAHTGWVLETRGSGGRAGRVFREVLVAGGIGSDAEDTNYPDYVIRIATQPADASGNSSANQSRTFSVVASTVPAGGSIGYQWYYSTTSATAGFNTATGVSGLSGATTASLTANSATVGANVWVKAVLSVTGGASVNTAAAKLTVTA